MFEKDDLEEALLVKSINQEVAIVISLRSSRKGKRIDGDSSNESLPKRMQRRRYPTSEEFQDQGL